MTSINIIPLWLQTESNRPDMELNSGIILGMGSANERRRSGRNEIWDALVLRTSGRAFALVRTRVLLVRKKNYKYLFTTPQQGLKRYWEKRRDDSLMLATIHEDTWKVLNMQHITPNSKSSDYSDMPSGGVWKIKGPTYLVDGSHQDPNPHPHLLSKKHLLHQKITMLWLPYLLRNNPHIKEFIDYMYLVNNLVIWGLNFQIHLTIPGISSLLVQVVIMICFWPGQFELLPTWYLEKLSFHISHSWFQCPGH